MEAVILWQSEQLQTKLLIRPGPWVGWGFEGGIRAVKTDGFGGRQMGQRESAGKPHVHR